MVAVINSQTWDFKTTHSLIVVDVRSPKSVSLGQNQVYTVSGGSQGESVSLLFLVSGGCPHSLVHGSS